MGTWTWTFVKPECLTKEQKDNLLKYAIDTVGGIYYKNYKKKGWNYELKDWLKSHKEDYDYFVNICEKPASHMTTEYLTKELRERINICIEREKCYKQCLNDEITFREMLIKTKQNDEDIDGDFMIINRQNDIYVNIRNEWWRNSCYSEKEFCTVDELIEEVSKSNYLCYYDDKTKIWLEETKLTPKLEDKLRKYYGKIGNNNFYVHFG